MPEHKLHVECEAYLPSLFCFLFFLILMLLNLYLHGNLRGVLLMWKPFGKKFSIIHCKQFC